MAAYTRDAAVAADAPARTARRAWEHRETARIQQEEVAENLMETAEIDMSSDFVCEGASSDFVAKERASNHFESRE